MFFIYVHMALWFQMKDFIRLMQIIMADINNVDVYEQHIVFTRLAGAINTLLTPSNIVDECMITFAAEITMLIFAIIINVLLLLIFVIIIAIITYNICFWGMSNTVLFIYNSAFTYSD